MPLYMVNNMSQTVFNPGIVSVTFRSLDIKSIVSLSEKAGLWVIEWGGDIHVPHGNIEAAENALALCRTAGIACRCYGSYYRLPESGEGFSDVLDTACALGCRLIRVWAGVRSSADADDNYRASVARRLRADAETAAKRGVGITLEYHGGTLTDNADSALRLLDDAGADNVYLHWQPNQFESFEYNVAALRRVAHLVDSVHVFAWRGNDKLPLADMMNDWNAYLDILAGEGRAIDLMLEFLPIECEADLLRDAATLRALIDSVSVSK